MSFWAGGGGVGHAVRHCPRRARPGADSDPGVRASAGPAGRTRVGILTSRESSRPTRSGALPTWPSHDHLHPHRRGAAAGDVLLPADHRGVRRQGGRRRRDPRHLAGRPDPRAVPRAARGPARRRRPRRARRAREAARGQHHQAAQHLRLDPAAQGRDQGAAGAGLRPAGLPREPAERRGPRDPRPLRQGQGLRGQPRAARGQLRPPRPRVGQGLRQGPPAPHGRLVVRLQDQRRDHGPGRLLRQREVGRPRADDTLRIEHEAADGTVTVLKQEIQVLAGEVVDGTFMNVAALRRFLTEQIARAKADDVLFSVHLKATMMKVSDPIIFGHVVQAFFPTLFEQYGERWPRPASRPTTGSARCSTRSPTCPRATRSRPPSSRASPTARRWRWSTPTRASPTCTCPPTSSSTPRCRR